MSTCRHVKTTRRLRLACMPSQPGTDALANCSITTTLVLATHTPPMVFRTDTYSHTWECAQPSAHTLHIKAGGLCRACHEDT